MAVPRTKRNFLFIVFPDPDALIRISQIQFNNFFKFVETVQCFLNQKNDGFSPLLCSIYGNLYQFVNHRFFGYEQYRSFCKIDGMTNPFFDQKVSIYFFNIANSMLNKLYYEPYGDPAIISITLFSFHGIIIC